MTKEVRPLLTKFEIDVSSAVLYRQELRDESSTWDPIYKSMLIPVDDPLTSVHVGTKVTRVLQETTDDE